MGVLPLRVMIRSYEGPQGQSKTTRKAMNRAAAVQDAARKRQEAAAKRATGASWLAAMREKRRQGRPEPSDKAAEQSEKAAEQSENAPKGNRVSRVLKSLLGISGSKAAENSDDQK